MTEGGVTSWSSASTSWERAAARWTVTFTWGEDYHLFSALLECCCYRKYSKRLKKDNHFYLGSRLWLCAVVLLLSTSVKKLCLLCNLISLCCPFSCLQIKSLQLPCTTSCTEKEWSQHCREKPKMQYHKFSDLNETGGNTLSSQFFLNPRLYKCENSSLYVFTFTCWPSIVLSQSPILSLSCCFIAETSHFE